MSQIKRVFIMGHPGAGKALLAKKLAERLGWQFIDADLGLEIHIGRKLTHILGQAGAKEYQTCQHEILSSLINQTNIVVTTDASIVGDEKNLQLLATEFVINLTVSTKVQLERTLTKPLPLLLEDDLSAFFNQLHQERDHLYPQHFMIWLGIKSVNPRSLHRSK